MFTFRYSAQFVILGNVPAVALAACSFIGSLKTRWHCALVAMVLAILPSAIVFVFLRRDIVDGVVAGVIKG